MPVPDEDLRGAAARLVALLSARGLSAATAESCTGGLAGAAITSVPGASAVYPGGAVTYSNALKEAMLGVPRAVLAEHGAVSAECAAAMARGARLVTGADIAVSVTGIAGPDGGTPDKPVGLVHFAVACADGVKCDKALFSGGRDDVRRKAAMHALGLLTAAATPA